MSIRLGFTFNLATLDIEHARAAVWGWLLARHHGGAFLVRGQDTAQVEAMCAELHWLGLDWDAPPLFCSARSALYRQLAAQLIEQGRAYERDGAIWLRVFSAGQTPNDNLVLQTLTDTGPGDRLLIATDGTPSSLWATVADEHMLEITHVIGRPEHPDDLSLQVELHRLLGRTPHYLHLPPVGEAKGIRLTDLRAEGYFPLAVVNALATLGWTPKGRRRLREMDELIARFDMEQVSHHALWSWDALNWFNRRYLNQLDLATLVGFLVPRWHEAFGLSHRADTTTLSPDEWQLLLTKAIRSELGCLSQAVELARPFFVEQFPLRADAVETLAQPYAPDVLYAFVEGLLTLEPFAYDRLDEFVSALRYRFKASHGIRSRDAMFVIRAALTGRLDGPCLIEACLLLGRARCLRRAQLADPAAGARTLTSSTSQCTI